MTLAFLVKAKQTSWNMQEHVEVVRVQVPGSRVEFFVLFLVLIGTVLVLVPEFVFLRDQFNNRMNTIFKFYYQAWMVWSIAASFGVVLLLQDLSGIWNRLYRIGLAIVLFMALIYPVLGLLDKTNDFKVPLFIQNLKAEKDSGSVSSLQVASQVWTLDGGNFLSQIYPDDMAAAAWLRTAPYGVIVEATKPDASYTDYGRFSTYSGLPTVLGWPMHEGQWRGTYAPQGTRQDDIRHLYETSSWDEATAILSEYGIRYVCVGTLERSTYHLNDNKFELHLLTVFQQGQTTIYEMP
jgi:uncharacterized membrane protein